MGKRLNPRHGSMQFWPRVRASRQYARVRYFPADSKPKFLGFAGYKAGMTHVLATDMGKTSLTKGERISIPVTVVECPPMKISSVRFYTPHNYGTKILKELFIKPSKEFNRKAPSPKTFASEKDFDKVDLSNITSIKVQVYTQPKMTGFGKKQPEVFELAIGGKVEEQLAFVKEHYNKDITINDVFAPGDTPDAHAVTTGKGNQGPVKRFGVNLRSHKSEKTIRGPGSLGGWIAQGHIMYRVAFSGQMGYHLRTQYDNQILAIIEDPSEINPEGGFINFGEVKNPCLIIRGSLPGPKKRLITLTAPQRPTKFRSLPAIDVISKQSKQGN